MKVIKRDGREAGFDSKLIYEVIEAASYHTEDKVDLDSIVIKVLNKLVGKDVVKVCEIQDAVEHALMVSKYKATAKKYIEYRSERDRVREAKSSLKKSIDGLFDSTNLEVGLENANKAAEAIATQRDLVAGVVAKDYALNHLLPKRVAKAHKEARLHFHDLDYSPLFGGYNCQLIGFKQMLSEGFKMGNANISTPRSTKTAATVITQIMAQVASSSYGGLTANNIDIVLAPYVEMSYKDYLKEAEEFLDTGVCSCEEYAKKKTDKVVYDAMQSIEYQINTLHTSNGQSPFSTLSFGLGTSYFEKLIQKNILKVRLKGLGEKGVTPVFPKLCFVLKRGHNLEKTDPHYDMKMLALKCQRKRIYPDILNYDKVVEVTGNFKAPMGCRSFLGKWTNKDGEEVNDSRNNLGVITVSPLLCALESGKDMELFWEKLEEATEIVKEGLDFRIKRFETVTADAAPILYQKGSLGCDLKPKDVVAGTFKDGFSSISMGYCGLHETVLYLTGEKPFEDKGAYDLQMQILKFLDDKTKQWKEETGYGYSTYATPNESTSLRLVKTYVEKYGVIEGVTDHIYLTNSFHLDVTQNCSAFDKIDFEAPFIKYTSGGFVTTVDLPNMSSNVVAHEQLVDYAYDKVPYFLINQPVDVCHKCDFEGEFTGTMEGYTCPSCGNNEAGTMNVIRRVSGYVSEPDARPFNPSKQNEVINRVKHI